MWLDLQCCQGQFKTGMSKGVRKFNSEDNSSSESQRDFGGVNCSQNKVKIGGYLDVVAMKSARNRSLQAPNPNR
jgi:hypothetical protein